MGERPGTRFEDARDSEKERDPVYIYNGIPDQSAAGPRAHSPGLQEGRRTSHSRGVTPPPMTLMGACGLRRMKPGTVPSPCPQLFPVPNPGPKATGNPLGPQRDAEAPGGTPFSELQIGFWPPGPSPC